MGNGASTNVQISSSNENPIPIVSNGQFPISTSSENLISTDLPIKVYEFLTSITSTSSWMEVEYRVVSSDAERIAVQRVAESGSSCALQYADHVTTLSNAVRMLQKHIQYILQFLEDVQNGVLDATTESCDKLLRKCMNLCHHLCADRCFSEGYLADVGSKVQL